MAGREILIGEPGVGFGHPFLAYALVFELERRGLSEGKGVKRRWM